MNLQIEQIIVGPIETNCFLVYLANRQALIIDPGGDGPKIQNVIQQKNLQPLAILNTHGHYDHVMANQYLQQHYDLPIYFPGADQNLLKIQHRLFAVPEFKVHEYYHDKIMLPGFDLQVIPTPGHTSGSSCLLFGAELFTGDTMFAEGIWGRTDLWEGSEEKIQQSLRRLLALSPQIRIYPGHGPFSTIEQERSYYGQ